MVVNVDQSQPLRSEEQEQKRRKLVKKNGMMRGWRGWYVSAACGSTVDLAEGSDDVGGSLGRKSQHSKKWNTCS